MADWLNRIKAYKQVPANELLANPDNARRHPVRQREALRGSLDTLGLVDAILVNTRTGYVIDGHARIEEALTRNEDMLLPVLEVDLSEDEEKLFLASFDWITAMAEYDRDILDSLMQDIHTDDERIKVMLTEMADEQQLYVDLFIPDLKDQKEPELQSDHLITIHCSASALKDIMPILEEINKYDGATVDIS